MGPQTLNKEGVKPTQSLPVAFLASNHLLCPSCGYEVLWGDASQQLFPPQRAGNEGSNSPPLRLVKAQLFVLVPCLTH